MHGELSGRERPGVYVRLRFQSEKKESYSMKKHRGLFLAFGLAGLVGLMAREAGAETITMTISTNGHTISVTGSLVSGTPTATTFEVNTTNLNATLAGDGSAYQFSALGANSNNPGSTGALGGYLTTGGNLSVLTTGTGVTGALIITTTENGFTAPTGNDGSLKSTLNANYNNTASGDNSTYQSSFNGSSTGLTMLTATSTGPVANNYSPSTTDTIGTVAAPYTLGNMLTFNLTKNTSTPATDSGFQGTAAVFASSVPEPASLVMMLTGLPVPLAVVSLLRRRRRRRTAA